MHEGKNYIGDRIVYDIPDQIEPCCKSMILMIKDHTNTKAAKCMVCNRLWHRTIIVNDKWEEGEPLEKVVPQTPFFGGQGKTAEDFKLDAMKDDLKELKKELKRLEKSEDICETKLKSIKIKISDELTKKGKELEEQDSKQILSEITSLYRELNEKYNKRELDQKLNKILINIKETKEEINYLEYEIAKREREESNKSDQEKFDESLNRFIKSSKEPSNEEE